MKSRIRSVLGTDGGRNSQAVASEDHYILLQLGQAMVQQNHLSDFTCQHSETSTEGQTSLLVPATTHEMSSMACFHAATAVNWDTRLRRLRACKAPRTILSPSILCVYTKKLQPT